MGRLVPISMLPYVKTRVQEYCIRETLATQRRKTTSESLIIKAGGDRYKIPEKVFNGLREALEVNKTTGRQLYVWKELGGSFRWEFETDSTAPVYLDNSQIHKAAKLPVGVSMDILEFGKVTHSRGGEQMFVRVRESAESTERYFLPMAIKVQMFDHVKKRCLSLSNMRGWRLIRQADGLVKTVPRSKHDEPPMDLEDGNGNHIRNHAMKRSRH
jgi:hypothetical protein